VTSLRWCCWYSSWRRLNDEKWFEHSFLFLSMIGGFFLLNLKLEIFIGHDIYILFAGFSKFLIRASFWWLLELHVFFLSHKSSQFLKNSLDCMIRSPARQKRYRTCLDRAIGINSVHTDSTGKPDWWRSLWILWAALKLQTVDPVLVRWSGWSDDHACPRC